MRTSDNFLPTARVIALTARPRDATSSRTVIEYETLGAMVTWIPALLPAGAVGIQAYGAQRVG